VCIYCTAPPSHIVLVIYVHFRLAQMMDMRNKARAVMSLQQPLQHHDFLNSANSTEPRLDQSLANANTTTTIATNTLSSLEETRMNTHTNLCARAHTHTHIGSGRHGDANGKDIRVDAHEIGCIDIQVTEEPESDCVNCSNDTGQGDGQVGGNTRGSVSRNRRPQFM